MASITHRAVAPPKELETINLHLTLSEARVLRKIVAWVAGEPNGPRGFADSIYTVLENADLGELPGGIIARGTITLSKE